MTTFAENAAALVARATKIPLPPSSSPPPHSAAAVAAAGAGESWGGGEPTSKEQASMRWLLQQMDAFVRSNFLPQTFVDLRAK